MVPGVWVGECQYKDGQFHGFMRSIFNNGSWVTGCRKNGQKYGRWTWRNPSGEWRVGLARGDAFLPREAQGRVRAEARAASAAAARAHHAAALAALERAPGGAAGAMAREELQARADVLAKACDGGGAAAGAGGQLPLYDVLAWRDGTGMKLRPPLPSGTSSPTRPTTRRRRRRPPPRPAAARPAAPTRTRASSSSPRSSPTARAMNSSR